MSLLFYHLNFFNCYFIRKSFLSSYESASILDCDNLIDAYIKKQKIKRMELPQKRPNKISKESVLFEELKTSEQEKLLDFFKK